MPVLYEHIIALHKPKVITTSTPELNLVMLTGVQQMSMLNQSLWSISKKFRHLPKVYLFTDKGVDLETLKRKLKWFPDSHLTIIIAESCTEYHRNKGNELLASFAHQNPMGLKLAAILQIADLNTPILYCDTDVLWHKDPWQTISELISNPGVKLALSSDFQAAYDQDMVHAANMSELLTEPFYCAGILFLKALDSGNRDKLQKLLEIAVVQSTHFTEQTIFAYLNKINGDHSLDKDGFAILLDDQFSLIPRKKNTLIARHYIGPVRHNFWRDAFFLKLGVI
ncbi:putative nucleotide-diphospho-sugar transferase [Paradesertivirga mongoliensis]|uniref:Nucleotide-diphospho-sugar transferase n=2 Tax=Paradesertivirga mongoliensis TaxID=2100740 RepID=A0ABW4ZGQ3_9SPHI